MEATVRALRELTDTLRRRPDIEMMTCVLGEEATAEELASLVDAPEEPVAFFREVNGVHIPPISAHTRFEVDVFAPGVEALFFDEQQPECTTWLVRSPDEASTRVITGSMGEPYVSDSIAAYVSGAMSSGFVPWWPMCFRSLKGVSYAGSEAAITRFRAKPKKPKSITPGARVHIGSFDRGAHCLSLTVSARSISAPRSQRSSSISAGRSGSPHA